MGKRLKAQNQIYALMDALDPSQYNSNRYREIFSKMNDKTFTEFMKNIRLNFEISSLDHKNGYPKMKKIVDVAKKFNIPLTEYVMFPHTNPDNPSNPSVSATKLPIFYIPIRKLQQMLDKKNKATANNDQTNAITGQVIGESKSASLNDTQTFALVTTNQNNSIKELLGPRADDLESKIQMLEQIERYGEVSLSDLNIRTENKQAYNTMEVFLKGALLMPTTKKV